MESTRRWVFVVNIRPSDIAFKDELTLIYLPERNGKIQQIKKEKRTGPVRGIIVARNIANSSFYLHLRVIND